MKLVRLEVRNYRSIRQQTGDEAIVFGGTDCLVGRNNAGKSNILKSIRYLLGEERLSEDLYYGRDTSLEVDIRGFFVIDESDLALLKIESKRDNIRNLVLADGTIGICRRSSGKDLEVIRYYPQEERLTPEAFSDYHSRAWDERHKEDFAARMLSQYPELQEFLTEGKESNKGEWSSAYDAFLSKRPQNVQFVEMPGPPPTGISADLKNMLPDTVFIPAVKEVSEATKTTRTGELGRLLNELSAQVQEDLDEAIRQSMAAVYARLNITQDPETACQVDERDPGVQTIEQQITTYTAETFQDIGVRLEFPTPESKVMFDNARVWIREQGFDEVPVDQSGEGVKRVLIFSLLRTLADLRQGRLSLSGCQMAGRQPVETCPPLLILYEEAELFLHPGLQRILLNAFLDLESSGAQVIFTTHSPFMLQSNSMSTISLVTKAPSAGTQVTEFHTKLRTMEPASQNLLLQVQNLSSYIFADRVLLVEGESDRIVLRKLAPAVNSEWDFWKQGIPVLSVVGKGNLPLFRDFLTSLGIDAFAVMDIDSVKSVLTRMCTAEEIKKAQVALLQTCDKLVRNGLYTGKINKKRVRKLASGYDWDKVFRVLDELCETLERTEAPTEEQVKCLARLVSVRETSAQTKALSGRHPDVASKRAKLVELLLDHGILLLTGAIEDYYPGDASNKIERALQFDPGDFEVEELRSHFTPIPATGTTDMEAFLTRVFAPR